MPDFYTSGNNRIDGETVEGRVEDIIFENPDNGFAVIVLTESGTGRELTASGIFPDLFPGELLKLTGHSENHPRYGETFRISTCVKSLSDDEEGLIAFLSCGLFDGVGAATAKNIVRMFGTDTASTILETPEKLALVRGISIAKAAKIGETFREYESMSEVLAFFAGFNVSPRIATRVYAKFGANSVAVTRKNPYSLIDEIDDLGFRTADRIAKGLDIDLDAGSRITAYIRYYLENVLSTGSVCAPKSAAVSDISRELEVADGRTLECLDKLICTGSVTERELDGETYLFLKYVDQCEQYTAERLCYMLGLSVPGYGSALDQYLTGFMEKENIELNPDQQRAVYAAVENMLSVITGGPGTGKTTIIKAVYGFLSSKGLKCVLAAPTGRAAKRMTDAVGYSGMTVHRLLEYSPAGDNELDNAGLGDESRVNFSRNEANPVDADVVIIDETSMMDTFLMYHLLKALKPATRLILLGDKDQLPSVGPGNVLRDIIRSGAAPTVTLRFVYRQSDTSLIAYNAQAINSGEMPEFNDRDRDFFIIREYDPQRLCDTVCDVVKKRLPRAYGIDPFKDIQVLMPTKKGPCGVDRLNKLLQNALNPARLQSEEKVFGENVFRTGDRVMQIRNNYDLEWESIGSPGVTGTGVFNGEMGVITDMDIPGRELTVVFDDDRQVIYDFDLLNQLELCYAVTVHKSQGSEFDYCIIPLLAVPPVLCTRNILYTAVTRAKKMVIIVGDPGYIGRMIANNNEEQRYTFLESRIKELASGFKPAPERIPEAD